MNYFAAQAPRKSWSPNYRIDAPGVVLRFFAIGVHHSETGGLSHRRPMPGCPRTRPTRPSHPRLVTADLARGETFSM
jgi:hypothetical protein